VASHLAHRVAAARLRLGLRRHDVALSREASLEAAALEGSGFGLKERAWNDRALLRVWRERWAEMANARLAELGHDQRIDHRSHAARGLGLEPQNKIGPAGARRAQRGEAAERAGEHRAIARRNGERLLARPELALEALTQQQSTFTRADLARLIHRQTDGAEQFAIVMAKAEGLAELVRVGEDGRGRARFSTREMVGVERQLMATAVALGRRGTHAVADKRRIAPVHRPGLSEEQHLAYLHVTRSRDLAVVVGIAGGGKSTMLGTARQAWAGQGYRVRGAALSGIAAEGLEGSAGIESRTIAGWEHAWGQGKERLTARDVLVVDEAGMVGSRQLGRLVKAVHAAGAKLVLVGDAEQLQAIEAGAAFRAIAERVGVIAITEPRRQVEAWQRLATKELATARTAMALDRYQGAGMVHRHATRDAAHAGVIAGWDAARRAAPTSSQIIFAHERADVRALNEAARAVRRAVSELGPDRLLPTEAGVRAFAEGDRVYFLRNERGLGVKNGTLGTLERIEGERLVVRLDGPDGAGASRAVTFDLAGYADLDHGYAATVHKNQGATVDQAHVLATQGMDRHLAYVALSRHRHAVQLHWGEDDFGNAARLRTVLGRERAKDTTLDYGAPEADPVAAYAERRGLDPLRPESGIVVRPEPGSAPVPPLAPVPGHTTGNAGPGTPEAPTPAPAVPETAPEPPRTVVADEQDLPEPDDEWAGPVRAPTAAELAELRRILSGEDEAAPPAVPGPEADPAPLGQAGPEAAPPVGPAPLLAAEVREDGRDSLGRGTTPEDLAAAVEASKDVQDARFMVQHHLKNAFRDPAEAFRRILVVEAEGGITPVRVILRDRPETLGRLHGRGPGVFTSDVARTERGMALRAAEQVGAMLNAQRLAEADAPRRRIDDVALRRCGDAVEVPGLSPAALDALRALRRAGADRSPEALARLAQPAAGPHPAERCAAAVAVAWARVRDDAQLGTELDDFARKAAVRLGHSEQQRLLAVWRGQGSPDPEARPGDEASARTAAAVWATRIDNAQALEALHGTHEAQRRHEAEQARRAAEEKAQAEAKAKAETDARVAAALARRHRAGPRASPGPGVS